MLGNVARQAASGGVLNRVVGTVSTATGWVTRSGTTLSLNGSPWRGAGMDWHWAGLRETNLQYPSHAMIDQVLDEAVAMNARVIRAHTLGMSAGLANQLVTGVNADGSLVWNTAAWEPIDYVIAGARSRGLKLWIPFTDQFNYYHGGKQWWVQQAFINRGSSNIPSSYTYGGTTETGVTSFDPVSGTVAGSARYKIISQQFYRNTWIKNAWINNYVVPWFNHVNQYSGVANKNEPAVAFAQAGNELWDSGDQYADHAGADGITWAAQFSAAVKSVSPNVLVVDPLGADGVNLNYAPGRNDPNTDIFDYHLYNNGNTITSGYISGFASIANSYNKVQVFGEYPYTNGGISTALSEMESTANVGFGCFWAIYTNDEGHSSGGIDDSVYVVGSNSGWKTQFTAHANVMNSGTLPPPPTPPTNLLRSAAAATIDAPVSAYAAGSTDSNDPALTIESSTGIGGGAALKAITTGSGHKWIYINSTPAAAAVTSGSTYTASAHVQLVSGTLGSGYYGHLTWFDSGGSYISGSTSSSQVTVSGSYVQVTWTAVAPANAAFAVPQIEFDGPASGSAVVRIDQYGIFAGASASPWSSP